MKEKTEKQQKIFNGAWIISVNMGYGHQRTIYPLKNLAFEGKIINANDYFGIPEKDKKTWERTRKSYEFISRFSRIPFIGNFIFSLFDRFQKIFHFYPKRDLSKPNFVLKQIYSRLKKGWGKHLIDGLKSENLRMKTDLPLLSTFFTPAFMADFFGYPGEIFCVVCDADISRTWVPLNPEKSKIKYFAPNSRTVERLKLYGIKPENIFLTGYPLPEELIGGKEMKYLKEDLKNRILNLDPQKKYFEKYKNLVENSLGKLPSFSDHPLTLMFAVGGAGAQKEIGVALVNFLKKRILKNEIKVILVAGIKRKVKEYFKKEISNICRGRLSEKIDIIFAEKINDYFKKFNLALRKTDILWTKPSELSFYSALGVPIIIAPPIGSQEEFNKRWLLKSGFGLSQESPKYVSQWLLDWLEQGYLAEAAMQGFIEGEKFGAFNINKIISSI